MTPEAKSLWLSQARANEKLSTRAEVGAWDEAVGALASLRDASLLPEMLMLFTDLTQNESVMFGLVHAIERFDPKAQIRAMIDVFDRLERRAPVWTERLCMRILNDELSRQSLRRVLVDADEQSKERLVKMLSKIGADATFAEKVRFVLG